MQAAANASWTCLEPLALLQAKVPSQVMPERVAKLGQVDQDEVLHLVDQDLHLVGQDLHLVDQDLRLVEQVLHLVDQVLHLVGLHDTALARGARPTLPSQ